ncbi:hypothetical protein [Ameyamaea chiangmaiensis]|uniref:hypothetical protein n=1 Tax=Ameyamaea chiangmaiensis TaxID=442969 RepID=UPI001FECEFC0|nr:hypothetical protein [Ameyamaea chiangmaiensis]
MRVEAAISLVFDKVVELGSAAQGRHYCGFTRMTWICRHDVGTAMLSGDGRTMPPSIA